jgi:hypothetical protein
MHLIIYCIDFILLMQSWCYLLTSYSTHHTPQCFYSFIKETRAKYNPRHWQHRAHAMNCRPTHRGMQHGHILKQACASDPSTVREIVSSHISMIPYLVMTEQKKKSTYEHQQSKEMSIFDRGLLAAKLKTRRQTFILL